MKKMKVTVVCHDNNIVFSDVLLNISKEIRTKYSECSVNLVLICDKKIRRQTLLQYSLIEITDLFKILYDFLKSIFINYKSQYDAVVYVDKKNSFVESINDSNAVYMITSKYIVPKFITDKVEVYNFHCGLLPSYRGLFPTFWSYMENEYAGLTLHKVDDKIDEGIVVANLILDSKNISYYSTLRKLYLSGVSLINNPTITDYKKKSILEYYYLPNLTDIIKYKLKRMLDLS